MKASLRAKQMNLTTSPSNPYCTTDHLDFIDDFCPECGDPVDEDGNTENMPIYCSRNCGCHGPGCPMGLIRHDH